MLTYVDVCSGVGARNSSVHAVVEKLQTGYAASVVAINGQRLSRNDLDVLLLVCWRMLAYAGVC
jgi:hypothetical protein